MYEDSDGCAVVEKLEEWLTLINPSLQGCMKAGGEMSPSTAT